MGGPFNGAAHFLARSPPLDRPLAPLRPLAASWAPAFRILGGVAGGDAAITVMELLAAYDPTFVLVSVLVFAWIWHTCSERGLAVALVVSAGPLSDKRPTKTSP